MNLAPLQHGPASGRRREASAPERATPRGFSLVELLVAIAVMAVLVGLLATALAAAREASRKQATQLLIAKLDAIVRQQLATYASRAAAMPPDANNDGRPDLPAGWTAAAYRSWHVRRNLISGDLPDNWQDVAYLASRGAVGFGQVGTFPLTAPQRAYASRYLAAQQNPPNPTWGDAECLFMIVMQGGIANCLDCGELKTADRGDKDGDGAFEFWDAWGNPIGFILWPAGVQLPPASGAAFFGVVGSSGPRPLEDPFPAPGVYPSPGLGMRPLIYSAGPDGVASIAVTGGSGNLAAGRDCGNPLSTAVRLGGFLDDPSRPGDFRADNITNLDAEAAK